jgi:hypothetical protein
VCICAVCCVLCKYSACSRFCVYLVHEPPPPRMRGIENIHTGVAILSAVAERTPCRQVEIGIAVSFAVARVTDIEVDRGADVE